MTAAAIDNALPAPCISKVADGYVSRNNAGSRFRELTLREDFFAGVDMSDEFSRPLRQLARVTGYVGAIVPGSRPYPINKRGRPCRGQSCRLRRVDARMGISLKACKSVLVPYGPHAPPRRVAGLGAPQRPAPPRPASRETRNFLTIRAMKRLMCALYRSAPAAVKRTVDTAISRSTRIPFAGVAHEPDVFLRKTSRAKIVKKYLHKHLLLKWHGQTRLQLSNASGVKRLLWIYTGKRNFGDATMDLSGRALLKDTGVEIDLFTLPNLHKLFEEDNIFQNVFSDLKDLSERRYDAILMSEYNLPSIKLKTKYFNKLPYACLFQYFYGPDRNQTTFSHAAVNHVFSLGYSDAEVVSISKPYLAANAHTQDSVRPFLPDDRFLAIAVGGIDANRTYRQWGALLELIDRSDDQNMPKQVVLLGSDNGLAMAEELLNRTFSKLKITSCVGKLTLLQSREMAAKASLFLGADGGLMHVAHSTPTPSVSLFSDCEPPYLRLTGKCHSIGIQSHGDVDEITPADVMSAIETQLARAANRTFAA
ncbi:glycosyltransferase family 9 protein [Paraburkholderia sediminicola]|uniref:glycosyltransferase family 9 protein n=1 Tax=Paraburkholderia sediminicola TaxID=458836 RepID=UPI0038B8AC82